jgi:protease-4
VRRYIVGFLATIGTLALIVVIGGILFVTSGPLSGKGLPKSIVLSIDLRKVPAEAAASGLLAGGFLNSESRDFTHALELLWQAADDPRIAGLYVEVGDDDAGLARVQELRQAIARIRGKGKFAIAFAEAFGGGSHFADYYLASAFDQIWLQPSGSFAITGLAITTPFVKRGLDKLGVQVEGGKRYEYKSAPDTFTETGYSGPARANLQQLVNSLYGQFVDDVAHDRNMPALKVRQLVDAAPFDAARAKQEGLVDRVGYRADAMDEVWRRASQTHDMASLAEYAADNGRPVPRGPVIALVRASGAISSGSGGGGPFDDDSATNAEDVVTALEDASQTAGVKAIVLRIDSPGGTYPASDAMANAVTRARAAGKPVVVSMGDIAASGGYLAAVNADVIVADPSTITGSIGVFGIWPVASELLDKLGISFEQIGVGANAGMYSYFRPPTAAQRTSMARELDAIYADFTRQVGEARHLDAERVDASARGRVFSGLEAKQVGLVDELGGLSLALSIAKAKAGIDEQAAISVQRFPAETSPLQRLIDRALQYVGVDEARGPSLRAPREIREALARVGVVMHPGNVRLPPLPPLWR